MMRSSWNKRSRSRQPRLSKGPCAESLTAVFRSLPKSQIPTRAAHGNTPTHHPGTTASCPGLLTASHSQKASRCPSPGPGYPQGPIPLGKALRGHGAGPWRTSRGFPSSSSGTSGTSLLASPGASSCAFMKPLFLKPRGKGVFLRAGKSRSEISLERRGREERERPFPAPQTPVKGCTGKQPWFPLGPVA